MLGFKFAKSCGWIARYWRSQTTGSATGTCNPTVNSVNGNAKIFRRYADRQTLGQHHTDGRLSKLTGINSLRGHETRSFWQAQSCRLGVSVIRVEVQSVAEVDSVSQSATIFSHQLDRLIPVCVLETRRTYYEHSIHDMRGWNSACPRVDRTTGCSSRACGGGWGDPSIARNH